MPGLALPAAHNRQGCLIPAGTFSHGPPIPPSTPKKPRFSSGFAAPHGQALSLGRSGGGEGRAGAGRGPARPSAPPGEAGPFPAPAGYLRSQPCQQRPPGPATHRERQAAPRGVPQVSVAAARLKRLRPALPLRGLPGRRDRPAGAGAGPSSPAGGGGAPSSRRARGCRCRRSPPRPSAEPGCPPRPGPLPPCRWGRRRACSPAAGPGAGEGEPCFLPRWGLSLAWRSPGPDSQVGNEAAPWE